MTEQVDFKNHVALVVFYWIMHLKFPDSLFYFPTRGTPGVVDGDDN